MDFKAFAKVNKSLLVTILVKQDMFVGAYDLICEYGYEDVDMSVLLRMCSRMILNLEFEYEEELLLLAGYIVKSGIYDEILLKYMASHFEGPVREMTELWKRVRGFSLDCYALEERILRYSMFTRIYSEQGVEVLKDYIQQGGNEHVVLAYLTFESYGYFVGGKETGEILFEALENLMEKEWECDIICRLALLKHDTEQNKWDTKKKQRAQKILEECRRERLKFEFFQNMPRELLQACQMEDKMFVECKAGPGAKVTLYYQVEREHVISEEKTEPLKERYQGIYNKEFILFYGEKLLYRFVIERNGQTWEIPQQILQVEAAEAYGHSKYQLLNRMLKLLEEGKTEELSKLEQSYLKQERQVAQLFELLD